MSPTKQRSLIAGLIVLGILIVGFFGLRALFALREFRRHGGPPPLLAESFAKRETDVELIRDWMTIPYISRTYQVNPRKIFEAVGVSPKGNEEKSLLQLNEEYFPDKPGIVIELVKTVIQAEQAVLPMPTDTHPEPPSPPVAP